MESEFYILKKSYKKDNLCFMIRFNLLIFIFFQFCLIHANELINSDYDNYYDYLELTGRAESPGLIFKSFSSNNWKALDEIHPWSSHFQNDRVLLKKENMTFELMDSDIYLSYNTKLPYSLNDGVQWQGRGLNGSFKTGISWKTKYVDITFSPEIWFAENRSFDLLNSASSQSDPFGYFNQDLDYPQRFGESAIFDFSLGQTDIRFNLNNFTFGFSTENITLGPAYQNPLILSNNASGFPHFDIGLRKTELRIGQIETRVWWGILKESENYNNISDDDLRLYSGFVLGYSPVFIPGLTIGFNWVVNSPGGEFGAGYVFSRFSQLFGIAEHLGDDNKDQKISLTFEWNFPLVGFACYAEWAREDFFPNLRQTLLTPEHSQFITLGLKKALPINSIQGFMLRFELTNLIQSRDYEIGTIDAGGNYYTHHIVSHGYTNNGQILGASVGPGSDSQYFEVRFYDQWGSVVLFGRRISWDKMYMYKDPSDTPSDMTCNLLRLEVQVDIGIGANFLYKNLNFTTNVIGSYMMNYNYIEDNDIFNFRLELGAKYRF